MNRIEGNSDYKNGEPVNGQAATLCPADAAAVDAVIGGDTTGPRHEAREERTAAWFKVLAAADTPALPADSDLLERTLAAIQADRMRIPSNPAALPARSANSDQEEILRRASRAKWRRRFAEFGAMAVAAGLFLAVTIDLLGEARQSQRRIACQANLLKVGDAMGTFASVNDGQLPSLGTPDNGNWLHGAGLNAPRNNAANLLPLIFNGLPVSTLFCAGAGIPAGPIPSIKNALPEISYSYRNLAGADVPEWDGRHETVVLADRNPVFVDLASGGGGGNTKGGVDQENSLNHGKRGQYLLRADQSATWEISPNVGPGGDNIWTIGSGKDQIAMYNGTEIPKSLNDVFLCP